MKPICVQAPAKVNLGLRILGTTGEGWHELETLMVKVTLTDVLRLSSGPPDSTIHMTGSEKDIASIPKRNGNLVFEALSQFRNKYGPVKVTVHLEKRIPSGAGLGGGSSDAAATLKMLRTITGRPEKEKELMPLAACIGADVPFFLLEGHALASGIGDELESVSVPCTWMVLLKPPAGVSTVAAYGLWDKTMLRQAPSPAEVLSALQNRDWDRLTACLGNDLAAAVLPDRGDMQAALDILREAGSAAVTVSGSGSTLVGVCASQAGASRVADRVAEHYPGWFCQMVKTDYLDGEGKRL